MVRTSATAQRERQKRYGARVPEDTRHDPYQPRGKYPATRCGNCGAVYTAGRWQWADAATTTSGTCPACRRIADRMPAGRLTLEGAYAMEHGAELVRMARHEAEAERSEHPLHRIMDIEIRANEIEIATTDIHLPRRIGEALRRAHDGRLTMAFGEDAYEIRARWQR